MVQIDDSTSRSDTPAWQYAATKEFLERFAQEYHRVDRLIPSPDLYHYTSVDGVHGLVEQQRVWLTNTAFLNDVTEMTMAVGMVEKTLQYRREKATGSRRAFHDAFHQHESWWKSNEAYVFCLSERGDQLSQWRAYGADGKGYSVGFDYIALHVALQSGLLRLKRQPELWFYRVLYDPAEQTDLIAWVVDTAASMYAGHIGDEPLLRHMLLMVDRHLNGLSPFLKHSSFQEEREARCVVQYKQTFPEDLSYRRTRGLLLPYIDVRIDEVNPEGERLILPDGTSAPLRRPVTEIVIGPRDAKAFAE